MYLIKPLNSGRLLVNGNDFYLGNSGQNLSQLALKTDIPVVTPYVHPAEKQCNYSYTHPTTKQCTWEPELPDAVKRTVLAEATNETTGRIPLYSGDSFTKNLLTGNQVKTLASDGTFLISIYLKYTITTLENPSSDFGFTVYIGEGSNSTGNATTKPTLKKGNQGSTFEERVIIGLIKRYSDSAAAYETLVTTGRVGASGLYGMKFFIDRLDGNSYANITYSYKVIGYA